MAFEGLGSSSVPAVWGHKHGGLSSNNSKNYERFPHLKVPHVCVPKEVYLLVCK